MKEEAASDEWKKITEKDGEIERNDNEKDDAENRFFSSTDEEEQEAMKGLKKKFKN